MKPKFTLIQKTVKIPVFSYIPPWLSDAIEAHVEKQIRDMEIEMFCRLAGITREEYQLRQMFPELFSSLFILQDDNNVSRIFHAE